MDTPDPSAPVPDDPTQNLTPPQVTHPGPAADVGPEPAAPIALGPVSGAWSPPPPPMPPTAPKPKPSSTATWLA